MEHNINKVKSRKIHKSRRIKFEIRVSMNATKAVAAFFKLTNLVSNLCLSILNGI